MRRRWVDFRRMNHLLVISYVRRTSRDCCLRDRCFDFSRVGSHPRLPGVERLEEWESDLLLPRSLHRLLGLHKAHRVSQALGALGAAVGPERFGPREEGR